MTHPSRFVLVAVLASLLARAPAPSAQPKKKAPQQTAAARGGPPPPRRRPRRHRRSRPSRRRRSFAYIVRCADRRGAARQERRAAHVPVVDDQDDDGPTSSSTNSRRAELKTGKISSRSARNAWRRGRRQVRQLDHCISSSPRGPTVEQLIQGASSSSRATTPASCSPKGISGSEGGVSPI